VLAFFEIFGSYEAAVIDLPEAELAEAVIGHALDSGQQVQVGTASEAHTVVARSNDQKTPYPAILLVIRG
jgi:hypothetical protein